MKWRHSRAQTSIYQALIEGFLPLCHHYLIHRRAPSDVSINTKGGMNTYELSSEIKKWPSTISTAERNISQNQSSHLLLKCESSISRRNNTKVMCKRLYLWEDTSCDNEIAWTKRRDRWDNLGSARVRVFDEYKC